MRTKKMFCGFDYDLGKAMREGNIFERIFHSSRVNFWLSAVDYSDKRVLDVGCNTGILLIPMLEKGINIKGVDISEQDIAKTKKILIERNLSEMRVRVADAEKLPFRDNTFEVVLLSDVLEHVENPQKVAKEVFRVTKKRGQILVTVPNGLHPVVKYPWVRKMLTGRKDVDEHLDVPYNFKKLINLFRMAKVIRKKYIGFWSEIFIIFEKN